MILRQQFRKWTVKILCAMREHPLRLSALKREIPSASKKALTASLRSLETARVVVRRNLSSSVLHVELELVEPMLVSFPQESEIQTGSIRRPGAFGR